MESMTIASLMTLVVSAIVSGLIAFYFDKRRALFEKEQEAKLERLRADLTTVQKDRDARREYEYEARKRLYEQCEPLLFQLVERSRDAFRRIRSVARTARHGNLGPSGWLSEDGYYRRSTIYAIFAPLAIFRLIERRLTLVDFTLDPYIAEQYRLAKCLYLSVTDDFDLAGAEPPVKYSPDRRAPAGEADSARYARQGIFRGVLDNLTESMIVDSPDGARLRTFGEFASEYQESASSLRRAFDETKHLLHAFHPQEKPVMWRLLLLQALIHRALLRPRGAPVQLDDLISEKDLKALDWRQKSESGVTHTDAVVVPMNAALKHFRARLEDVSEPFKVYEVRATA